LRRLSEQPPHNQALVRGLIALLVLGVAMRTTPPKKSPLSSQEPEQKESVSQSTGAKLHQVR